MNRVLRDILSRTVDKDLEGIVDIHYDKSTIDNFYNDLENVLIVDKLSHVDNPVLEKKIVEDKIEYILQYRKIYRLGTTDSKLNIMLEPYDISRISSFGLYSDKELSDEEIRNEIEEYFKYGNNEFSKDLSLELVKKDNHESILLHTLSRL